jgi:phage shock protein PspC (stress-responsive transcriptional regulator)|tara:strand:- start:87 stop:278 length:192 start_codon:yes stop_codon:yes gene_type:complete
LHALRYLKRLHRFKNKEYPGGVWHNIGEYTGKDPIIWRILAVFNPFLLIYLILWAVMPVDKTK